MPNKMSEAEIERVVEEEVLRIAEPVLRKTIQQVIRRVLDVKPPVASNMNAIIHRPRPGGKCAAVWIDRKSVV